MTLIESAYEIVGKKKAEKSNAWISDKTLQLVAEKRDARVRDPVKFQELKSAVQRSVRQDKESYTESLCDELESESKRGATRKMFQQLKRLTGRFAP